MATSLGRHAVSPWIQVSMPTGEVIAPFTKEHRSEAGRRLSRKGRWFDGSHPDRMSVVLLGLLSTQVLPCYVEMVYYLNLGLSYLKFQPQHHPWVGWVDG